MRYRRSRCSRRSGTSRSPTPTSSPSWPATPGSSPSPSSISPSTPCRVSCTWSSRCSCLRCSLLLRSCGPGPAPSLRLSADHGDGLPGPVRALVGVLRRARALTGAVSRDRCRRARGPGFRDFAVTSGAQQIPNPRSLAQRNVPGPLSAAHARCTQGSATAPRRRRRSPARTGRSARPEPIFCTVLHRPGPRPCCDRDRGPGRVQHGPQPSLAKAISDCCGAPSGPCWSTRPPGTGGT